ncbi:MAG: hypothetical protein KF745_01550 [Phycisphaeraceae bacterium]|nr:hypothetical protein [Phycisphaeraceae bacterium]
MLTFWRDQVSRFGERYGLQNTPLRVVVDRASTRPAVRDEGGPLGVVIENDVAEFRGTGGLLRDLTAGYEPDDYIVVANGAQVLLRPLPDLIELLAQALGDINLLAHDDGSPVGLMLVSCRALRAIKDRGFVDFKEQALPELAKSFDVRVVTVSFAAAKPIRNASGYLTALWHLHRSDEGLPDEPDPFLEDWFDTFGIIEPGASVDPTARIHDSVVLDGARVGAGAVLVRSVVCRGGVVRPGEVVTDQVVGAGTKLRRLVGR